MPYIQGPDLAKEILVLTSHKSFWAASECQVFPNRFYSRTLFAGSGKWGSVRNPMNVLTVALAGYRYVLQHRPKLILFGRVPRVANWFALLKRNGLLPDTKLVTYGAFYLNPKLAHYFDKLIVYSRSEIAQHALEIQPRCVFVPLPADGDFETLSSGSQEKYIFSGGGAGRDFYTLIEAIRGLDIRLKIVTFSPNSLGYSGKLPDNCEVEWRMPLQAFLQRMATARFVVVPLEKGIHPHGHTTAVQALRLGRPVITSKHASMEDYVGHNREGLLVEPGDVTGYREAITRLYYDSQLFASASIYAREKAQLLTYDVHADRLLAICREVLES